MDHFRRANCLGFVLGNRMKSYFTRLLGDDSGAVTVDWVVLTAAVVGLAVLSFVALSQSTRTVNAATAATVLSAQEFVSD